MRVLGVDPGSTATGFGLVERSGGTIRHLRHGVLRTPKGADLPERLHFLHAELQSVLLEERPDMAVVERVFLASNARSALVLGQARGALLASLGEARVPVSELAARQVKKAVTGTGAADKSQMQGMVARLLGLERPPATDAADALALALAFAQAGPLAELPVRRRRGSQRRSLTRLVLERSR
ncbi:MAG TPA: crossover junction endodeoxyribonuclease RuvC [Myxococcota bacterium]|nr:crossover junction endodeoxyribonuclease RuvC [Myxococcota bacterium]